MKYKIKYFHAKSQSIKEKEFRTYDAAEKWARKNLTNFNHDLINPI